MLPNYLIIGAARCGTSWLAKNLKLHPEVFMHARKELHFFDQNYDKGIQWYEQKFENASGKAVGEGTPAYLYYENVAELIKLHIPNTKLIVSLRDPVDRAYSHYLYRERERIESNQKLTFEEKLEATPRLIEEGLYARKLKKYYDLFPSEYILVVLYDELKKQPTKYLKKVYSFLNVDTEFQSPLVNMEINSASSKLGKIEVLDSLYRALVKLRCYGIADSVNKFNRKKEFPPVNRTTRKKLLEDYYLTEIENLEKMIGQDLSLWKES